MDFEMSSANTKSKSTYPKPSDHLEEKSISHRAKTLKKIHQNSLRIFKITKVKYFYLPRLLFMDHVNFYSWRKVEIFFFFLLVTKLRELFSRPVLFSAKSQLLSQDLFTRPFAKLITTYLSIFNYIYSLLGSSNEEEI